MVNIVTLGKKKYLVDVGFGPDGPCRPIPLDSKYEAVGIAPQMLKLEYRCLSIHSDPEQRLWVFSHKRQPESGWLEAYAFSEMEFFPEDFEVMNFSTMTSRRSFFTHKVICVKAILSPGENEIEGIMSLYHNEGKKRIHGEIVESETFATESERIQVLENWFGIRLSEKEKLGINNMMSELPR
jgi:arylamine N-acetyltransferase